MRRRAFIATLAALPLALRAEEQAGNGHQALLRKLAGGKTPQAGRVRLEMPGDAENGNSVGLKVTVDGSGQGAERVVRIHLVSELNPYAHMASFRFGPDARRAQVETRVKLAATQRVFALAELADGSMWSDSRYVSVAFAACYEGTEERP